MALLNYKITVAGGEKTVCLTGSRENPDGIVKIRVNLPAGTLKSVTAELPLRVLKSEKIFMNGYQTWTHCPEYTVEDKIPGLKSRPQALVDYFGLDRYGDYLFTDYPDQKGVTHGWSWCYFRDGERYRLIASLDERPGYTGFRYDANTSMLTVWRDCAGVRCGGAYEVLSLYFAEGTEQEVFDGWFEAMNIKPRTTEKIAGYSSWYNRYQNISEKTVRADLAGCMMAFQPDDLFQIDDGWEPAVGDWLEADGEKFPCGMGELAEEIHGAGLRAGLWLAPFVCQKDSALFRNHPDWCLKDGNKPWRCGSNWGGFYALDIDNPAVIAYLEKVFHRVLFEWNYDLVKLDFLYGAAPYGTEDETRAGRMYRALELLRKWCGDKLILGCGVPVMPAFGIVDYCRISGDVGLDWNDKLYMRLANRERVSTRNAIDNTIFRRQLNGRAYLSDPDVFFLRDKNIRLTKAQKLLLADVNVLLGGVLLTSDDPGEYTKEAKAKYAQLREMMSAEQILVDADGGAIRFRLNGTRYLLSAKNSRNRMEFDEDVKTSLTPLDTASWMKRWKELVPPECRDVPVTVDGKTVTAFICIGNCAVMLQNGLLMEKGFFDVCEHMHRAGYHVVWLMRCTADLDSGYLKILKRADNDARIEWRWKYPTTNFGRWITDNRQVTVILQYKTLPEEPLKDCDERLLQRVFWAESTGAASFLPSRTRFLSAGSPATPKQLLKWLSGSHLTAL